LGEANEFFSAEELAAVELKPRPVGKYWMKAMQKVEPLSELIMPCDEPALEFLKRMDVVFEAASDDYTIRFHFQPNEFFEDETLALKFVVDKNEDCTKIESQAPKWKAGKALTEKLETKTQTNKKTKKKRTVEKKVQQESFFQIFKNRTADEEGPEGDEDDDTQGLEDLYNAGSIGDMFSIVKYFFTKYHAAAHYEAKVPEFQFDDGDMEGDDEHRGDDDDDHDDDEGEDKPKRKKSDSKKPKKDKGDANAEAKPEECKKQ